MKKILLVLLLLLGFGLFGQEIDPILEPTLEEKLESLMEENRELTVLKDHYRRMAVYSETAKDLALVKVENYKSYTINLERNIENSTATIKRLGDIILDTRIARDIIIDNKDIEIEKRNIMLYEKVQMIQIANNRIEELEEITLFNIAIIYKLFIGMLICFILYFVQSMAGRRRPRSRKAKPTKTAPLKAVKKDTPVETTKTKPEPKPKTEPEIPVRQYAEIPSMFSIFLNRKMKAKDLKRKAELDRRRAKNLTQKKTDVVEKTDRIKSNNKALLGGCLSKFICTVLNIPVPVEESPKEEPKKTPPKKKNTPNKTTTKGGKKNGGKKSNKKSSTKNKKSAGKKQTNRKSTGKKNNKK